MSNVLFVISPTVNALFDKKKGTSGNKIDCATKHFVNAAKYNVAMGTTLGVAGAIGYAKAKSTLNGNYFKKAAQIFKAIPTPVKVIAGALWGTALVIKNYKKGKIEQKYIDRAQFVDHTFNLDGEGAKARKLK